MESKTFILNKKKTFRRGVRIFVKGLDGKLDMRICQFTTEHKVSPKERKKRARGIAAEYTTTNPAVIEAMMRDSAYGKDFTLKSDPNGELKEKTIVVTPQDAKRIALESLCRDAGVAFENNAPLDVLSEKYKLHVAALAGKPVESSGAKVIPIKEVDVKQTIADTANEARKIYEEKYGEPVPEEVTNDLGFLSALADPEFDAKAYIASLSDAEVTPSKETTDEPTIEQLRDDYFKKFKHHVANSKKNDVGWIKKKLTEE